MALQVWRLVTLMLAAASMGVALCHLMEMPGKMQLAGSDWLMLLKTVYPPAFGTIGGFLEVAAIAAAVALALAVRRYGRAFPWTLLGVACLGTAHAVFWVWVAPVNEVMALASPVSLPPDWMALRVQWEHAHAARAVLQLAGLGALQVSVLFGGEPRSVTAAGRAAARPIAA